MGNPAPKTPHPGDRGWEIAFTRLSREVLPHVEAGVQGLTRRFQARGLLCGVQKQHTPRGLSTFLSVVGQRGLLFIVDFTLIDGLLLAGCPGAALEVRMLDACGETLAQCAATPVTGAPIYSACAAEILAAADLPRCATTMFVMALGRFDLAPVLQRRFGT